MLSEEMGLSRLSRQEHTNQRSTVSCEPCKAVTREAATKSSGLEDVVGHSLACWASSWSR